MELSSSRDDGRHCRHRELQMGPQEPGDQNTGGGETAGASGHTGKNQLIARLPTALLSHFLSHLFFM